jgi:hypothetical protein
VRYRPLHGHGEEEWHLGDRDRNCGVGFMIVYSRTTSVGEEFPLRSRTLALSSNRDKRNFPESMRSQPR